QGRHRQDPNAVPMIDLDPQEIVRRIETCGAWMVLKRVETYPAYRAMLEETLLSVARANGPPTLADASFEDIRGFMFVSSPNSTTPSMPCCAGWVFHRPLRERISHSIPSSSPRSVP